MDKKKIILNFIKKNKISVISTVDSENKPESAVIEFGQTDDLEIIFDAYESSRKVMNIKQNNHVAFVIGWDKNITVQYEGEAYKLSGQELEDCKKIYKRKNSAVAKWENRPGIKFFKVIPKWIRYSDLNKDPWKIFLITF